jgi:hypothetical protein
MVQEVGETTVAILEHDEKEIEKILYENSSRKELYWIVLFVKPINAKVDGKAALMKVLKPYFKKPASQVGMIIGEVNNQLGKIKWEVNMPDRPFGYELLGLEKDGVETYETSIPSSYLYN